MTTPQAAAIPRYRLNQEDCAYASTSGDYVRYADHAQALAEVQAKNTRWAKLYAEKCLEAVEAKQVLAEARAAVWKEAAEKCDGQRQCEAEGDAQRLCEMLRNAMLFEWNKLQLQASDADCEAGSSNGNSTAGTTPE